MFEELEVKGESVQGYEFDEFTCIKWWYVHMKFTQTFVWNNR